MEYNFTTEFNTQSVNQELNDNSMDGNENSVATSIVNSVKNENEESENENENELTTLNIYNLLCIDKNNKQLINKNELKTNQHDALIKFHRYTLTDSSVKRKNIN